MNCITKHHAGPGLELTKRPVPKPGPNDVLIKVTKAAICGTDIHIDLWDDWAQKTVHPPLIIGHEYVGTIEEVGSNATGFKKGDRVSGEGHIVCGKCKNCLTGKPHYCPNTQGLGYDTHGAFAEYVCIPASNVWVAEPSIPDQIMACFDPFGNAVHTALSYDLSGQDVLITGAGPIGCMGVAIAKHTGARNIVVTELNPYRIELAKKMGATAVVDPTETPLESVMKDLSINEGFDIGLEMSGAPKALHQMIDSMINGGKILLLGLIPDGAPIEWTKVIFKSLTMKGIYGRKMFDTWYKSTALIQAGLDLTPIITHKFHFKDFRQAFDLMKSGNSGKIILEW